MPANLPTFADCFADLPDPRNAAQCDHKLLDILFIAVCATICGADGFTEMQEFGLAKEAWLRQFLELPSGIPSHDTFNRVLQRLRPKEFQARLLTWIHSVADYSGPNNRLFRTFGAKYLAVNAPPPHLHCFSYLLDLVQHTRPE